MEYLNLKELAHRWKVSDSTLRRWMREGRMTVVKIGTGIRVSMNEVRRMEMERLPCSPAGISGMGGSWATLPGGSLVAKLPDGSLWVATRDGWKPADTNLWESAA